MPAESSRVRGQPNCRLLQSTKFEFVINLHTARALNIEVPAGVLAIVDEVDRHVYIFASSERIKQVVCLKDETDSTPDFNELRRSKLGQLATECEDAAKQPCSL